MLNNHRWPNRAVIPEESSHSIASAQPVVAVAMARHKAAGQEKRSREVGGGHAKWATGEVGHLDLPRRLSPSREGGSERRRPRYVEAAVAGVVADARLGGWHVNEAGASHKVDEPG